jgi:alpha-1,6-mannosyltransferase
MDPTGRAPLHVVDTTMFWSATGGGVRRYLTAKHDWLARQPGWRHTIAVTSGADEAGVERLPGVPIPASGGYRLALRRHAIAERLAALAPDVVEAGDPFVTGWAAADAAARCGVPAVAYCHSNVARMAGVFGGPLFARPAAHALRAYARRLYTRFDRVLAPSDSMRRELEGWGVRGVFVQPLGVDTGRFHPGRRSAAWRLEQGCAADDRVLVYVGRFAPEKHLDMLAAAVDRLGAPYRLLCIGAGPKPPRGERVRVVPYLGGADAVATALASADAFVHAGDQETFGLSVLEALACGTPVAARRAGGLAELVDASVGASVEASDAAGWAEAIEALLTRPRAPLGASARRRALAYDWENVLPQFLDHYRALSSGATTSARNDGATPAGHGANANLATAADRALPLP